MRLFKIILGLLVICAVTADAQTILPAPTADAVYVRVQMDFRKCASPYCGGFFISALNKRALLCSDGSKSERCYVAEIDWSRTGLGSSQIQDLENATATGAVIVFGKMRPFDDFIDVKPNTLGVLDAGRAWIAATDAEPKGYFFQVEDLGIRCITTPCYYMRATYLNWFKSLTISGLNLNGVGADSDQIERAWDALADGRLLVAGKFLRSRLERSGRGKTLTASQFYLPVDPLECEVDEDCTVSAFIAPVEGPEDCYCPTCPVVPMSVQEEVSNEKQWREYCEDARLICPLYPCTLPRPVGCVNNQCEFLP